MSRKIKSIDHEVCDYDEAYNRESASDIGWCGKCKIPECPYNKDLNEKKRMGWNNTMKRWFTAESEENKYETFSNILYGKRNI